MPPLFIKVELNSDDDDQSYNSLLMLEHPLDYCDQDDSESESDMEQLQQQHDHDNNNKMKKTVTFALHCTETYPVPHLNDLCHDDNEQRMDDLYYSRSAIRAMKRAALRTVQTLHWNFPLPPHETARGLQHLVLATTNSSGGAAQQQRRHTARKQRIQAVVRAQDYFEQAKEENTFNDADNDDKKEQYLKRLSESYSRPSLQQAVAVAQQDAAFAREYLASTGQEQAQAAEAEAALVVVPQNNHDQKVEDAATAVATNDEDDVILPASSICLSLCSLRRSWTRLSGGCRRRRCASSLSSSAVVVPPATALEYVIPVV